MVCVCMGGAKRGRRSNFEDATLLVEQTPALYEIEFAELPRLRERDRQA